MLLYHYTCVEYLSGIATTGLRTGDVPTSPTTGVNAVWFTTDLNPQRHGLSTGGRLTAAERKAYAIAFGKQPHAEAEWPDKTKVRLSADISEDDLALRSWRSWAIENGVTRQWRRHLDKAAGGGSDTWWLYFWTISADRLAAFDTQLNQPIEGWPDAFARAAAE
jgi:hypothetical protein